MTTIILNDEVAPLEAERKESTTASTDNISQYLFDALITSDAEEFSILKTVSRGVQANSPPVMVRCH